MQLKTTNETSDSGAPTSHPFSQAQLTV